MKVIGAIVYLMGFLGIAFIVTETRISLVDSFGGILLTMLWLALTMGIGTALMNAGNNNNNNDKQ